MVPSSTETHAVLEPALRVEQQGLGARPRCEVRDRLRGEGVEPAEPVLPRDGHDTAVGEVDDRAARGEHPLLSDGLAVVGRDAP